MLYCGKPPKEKYKKTGENIKKHDLFIYFSFGANGATSYTELTLRQVPTERLSGLNGIERRYYFNHGFNRFNGYFWTTNANWESLGGS